MSDRLIFIAADVSLSLWLEDDEPVGRRPWQLIGDLRAPGSGWSDEANYDCRDAMQELFPQHDYDPESSCFYAYTRTEAEAMELGEAIKSWVLNRRAA